MFIYISSIALITQPDGMTLPCGYKVHNWSLSYQWPKYDISISSHYESQVIVTWWLHYKTTVTDFSESVEPRHKIGYIVFRAYVSYFPREMRTMWTLKVAFRSRCFHILDTLRSRFFRILRGAFLLCFFM